jgi:DMSO/TMAO reductase YedYZ molybdopterin-dependent catalytic subunit
MPGNAQRIHPLAVRITHNQITRHICIEGWSAIKWRGVPLRDFLARIGADTRARYISFRLPPSGSRGGAWPAGNGR